MAKKHKKKRKHGAPTSLKKARHGAGVHHESSYPTAIIDSEFGGGGYHHSPRKVDTDGIPIYERTLISERAIETYKRLHGGIP